MAFAQPSQMSQDGDVLATVLDTLKRDPSIEFGDPAARIEHLARVDRPFSTVHRVRIHTPTRSVTAYAKILKPYGNTPEELALADRMLRREFKATKGLFEVLRQDSEIGAVRPIAFLPEHLAVVTEEIPGRPFTELLDSATRRAKICWPWRGGSAAGSGFINRSAHPRRASRSPSGARIWTSA